jgi:hypothetical protein
VCNVFAGLSYYGIVSGLTKSLRVHQFDLERKNYTMYLLLEVVLETDMLMVSHNVLCAGPIGSCEGLAKCSVKARWINNIIVS